MTQMRLLSIVVLLLLASSIKECDAQVKANAAGRKKMVRGKQKAQADKAAQEAATKPPDAVGGGPGPGEGVVPVGGAPQFGAGVVPIGGGPGGGPGGGGMRPFAPSYAGFFCGPPDEGEEGIMKKCQELPICKFKRVEDGAKGKVLTGELEEGQGDCMRRCDTRFGMSEEMHCGVGETCHSFIMGCPCDNLGDKECHPYKD